MRSEQEFPYTYEITEEGHHFEERHGKYYRVSKIYKNTIDKKTDKVINKELIWNNNSLVMFDHNLIPKELIRN